MAAASPGRVAGSVENRPPVADDGLTRADMVVIVRAWVASRAMFYAVLAIGIWLFPDIVKNGALDPVCRWDCGWYMNVAASGYDPVASYWHNGSGANWAFFPALPLLAAAAHAVTQLPIRWAALLATELVFIGTLTLFFVYARDLRGRAFAAVAVWTMALWPPAIYMAIPMSEALFVPLSIGVVIAARRDRWLVAGLLAALLSATRIVGIFIVIPMLTIAVQRYGWRRLLTLRPGTERVLLGGALAGLGLGLFMLHQFQVTGDALAFKHIQVAWVRETLMPWDMILRDLNPMQHPPYRIALHATEFAVLIAGIALLWPLWRARLLPDLLFAAALIGIVLMGGRIMSIPRVLGSIFPLILGAALVFGGAGRRRVGVLIGVALSLALATVWVLEGILGAWSELAM